MTRRAEFSRKTKLAAWQRSGGRCECGCGRKLNPGAGDPVEYDHRIPCEMGGDNSLDNCVVLYGPCHKGKTAADMKVIAKARSVQARHIGARTVKSKIPGSKGSGFRKKLDGTVIRVKE